MQGTRERVLDFIMLHREVRIEELVDELGISSAAVRRHLDNLRADGLVDVRPVKQATGRPYYSYFATERATPPMPPAYADLLERMLRSVGEKDVTKSVAESLASRHRAEVAPAPGADPEQLVVKVTQSLRQDGILESWHAADDGYHLVNNACPYIKAAEISTLPCESDRKAIELLIGLDVQQLNRIVDGAPCCEYLVHSGQGPESQQLIELG